VDSGDPRRLSRRGGVGVRAEIGAPHMIQINAVRSTATKNGDVRNIVDEGGEIFAKATSIRWSAATTAALLGPWA
jgi:hypothetical protein